MAHTEQKEFCLYVKEKFPNMFHHKVVIDCGSLDINGNNRYLFYKCSYTGIDIVAGKNVDIVNHIHKLDYIDNIFDVVISTEMFEHDRYYLESLTKMIKILKSGGLLLFTCATRIGDHERKEHGTINCLPECSPATTDYYKNVTMDDIRNNFSLVDIFSDHEFALNKYTCDLYFWGKKR